jgi:hypothetical protein
MTDAASIGDNQPPPDAGLKESLPLTFAELMARVDQLVEACGRIPAIDNEDVAGKATTFMGQIGAALKRCKEGKTEARKPLTEDAATIKDFFDDLERRLKRAQDHVREPLTAFQLKKDQEAREAREKQQEAARAGQEPERDEFGLPPITDSATRDDLGQTTTISTTWHYELEALELVPREFLQLDPGKVNRAVKAGAREIPGIRIFDKQQAVTRAAPRTAEEN